MAPRGGSVLASARTQRQVHLHKGRTRVSGGAGVLGPVNAGRPRNPRVGRNEGGLRLQWGICDGNTGPRAFQGGGREAAGSWQTGTYGLKVQMSPNPPHSGGDHLSPARTSRSLTHDFICKEHQGPLRSTSLSSRRWEHAPPLPAAGSRPPFHVTHRPSPCVQNSPTKRPRVGAPCRPPPPGARRGPPRGGGARVQVGSCAPISLRSH